VVLSPAAGHPVCDLNLQRRIREARIESLARALRKRRRREGAEIDLGERGEDVWHALRY